MRPVTLIAPAKVNFALHITGMRPNGYHELDSIFWPLDSPCDLLHLPAGAGPGLSMTGSEPDIDCASNTLTRAYALFREATGWTPALSLRLEKHIPHGAGLGGGSSDAASLLRWLNEHARGTARTGGRRRCGRALFSACPSLPCARHRGGHRAFSGKLACRIRPSSAMSFRARVHPLGLQGLGCPSRSGKSARRLDIRTACV